jgi:hypothetical protein
LLSLLLELDEDVIFFVSLNILHTKEPSCIHKGKFIGRARIVVQFAIFVFDDDCVADGKVEKNTLDLGIVLGAMVSEVLVELGVVEVHIGNLIPIVMIHVQAHLITVVSFKRLRWKIHLRLLFP